MLKLLLRALGVVVAVLAAIPAVFASIARIDSGAELEYIERLDVVIGFLFGLASVLWRLPGPPATRATRHVATAVGAALIWAIVTAALVRAHREQVRVRSALAAMRSVRSEPPSFSLTAKFGPV
jgi:hypothetical protein